MKITIERPCAMPIEVETLNHSKYVVKLTVAGEKDLLTYDEAVELFTAMFVAIGEIDDRIDRKERNKGVG